MDKIVIIPAFASSHLLEYWLSNVQYILNPNLIIIRESLFKNGPENKGHIDANFLNKWTHNGHGKIGFDWEDTKKICSKYSNILLEEFESNSNDVDSCFLNLMSYDIEKYVKFGTKIFPLEPDAFLFEGDKEIINEEISKLKPGQGLKCLWRDFLETQYYCEAINELQPKIRRFCYCFDNMENYKKAMNGFMSQNYPLLEKTDKFWIRHYPWFVFDKWKELRYDLIWRSDPQYWKDFERGLQKIRTNSQEFLEHRDLISKWVFNTPGKNWNGRYVEIRPSRQDEGRWAQFIDIQHPKHINDHPNFIKFTN